MPTSTATAAAVTQSSASAVASMQFGGYADTIVLNAADFDAVEVHPVSLWQNPDDPSGTYCEVCDEDTDTPDFWSAYVHCVAGGVECVGDFATYDEADAYAREVAAKHSLSTDFL